MPSRSTVLIVALWGLAILGAAHGASSPLAQVFTGEMTLATLVTLLVMPILFFGVMSFWMPHSPFYHPRLARIVDARFGANALASFLVRLKPMLMFAAGAAIQGALGLWQSYSAGAASGAYATHGFFLSGGIAFALSHAVLYYRRALGVYPAEVHQPATERDDSGRKPLGEALRIYWWTLIGLAAFPTLVLVAGEMLHVPFEFFVLPFFAVALLAGWPYFSGKAPYSFWIVACGVWLLGGIAAAIVAQAIRMLLT